MITKICSFGYKHGEPATPGPRIDVRPVLTANPHSVPRLRALNGTDPQVAAWLLVSPGFHAKYHQLLAQADAAQAEALATDTDPGHTQTLWVGCFGGKHRSVYVAERMGRDLGLPVEHRDLEVK